ncbi:MAG: ribose 5-phosphate isomerase B [Bacilli bacterium]
MNISIGSDHGGYMLKKELIQALSKKGYEVIDCGTHSDESVDYPVYAEKVSRNVQSKRSEFGVLICVTGIGMCISANKFKGIRAALVNSTDSAIMTRRHNNSNIICMGAKYTSVNDAVEWIDTFVREKFEGGRHQRRIDLINKQEE